MTNEEKRTKNLAAWSEGRIEQVAPGIDRAAAVAQNLLSGYGPVVTFGPGSILDAAPKACGRVVYLAAALAAEWPKGSTYMTEDGREILALLHDALRDAFPDDPRDPKHRKCEEPGCSIRDVPSKMRFCGPNGWRCPTHAGRLGYPGTCWEQANSGNPNRTGGRP